ncbi:hypothetical protein NHX12_030998 [Muraenolepis orangiensis]|uniref:RNA methyltransferase n=1 Tax=Muraenolepis orangiensis TaxID=630683 RepID=A0A9Q0ECG4_9TELE|nr:hypothetical protein NHX12_030998 [Muraenolepis orangiensis]
MAACEQQENTEDSDDPGAAPYGNFINYYTFNPPENRLALLPETLLQDLGYRDGHQTVLMLDVGCNSGDLSVALYKHLVLRPEKEESTDDTMTAAHILGFDLDESLIQRAQETNPHPGNISFIPLDITTTTSGSHRDPLQDYLQDHGNPRFQVCFCFAVTMWVHLNHGDAALLTFLSRLASMSDHLVLEAQPWKCYRSAARRLRKLGRSDFDHFKGLRIRGDVAQHARDHLEALCGMELIQSFGRTAWDRKVLLFKRKECRL